MSELESVLLLKFNQSQREHLGRLACRNGRTLEQQAEAMIRDGLRRNDLDRMSVQQFWRITREAFGADLIWVHPKATAVSEGH